MFTGSERVSHELAASAAFGEPEALEAHEHGAGEAVVDLGEVDVGRREPGRAPEVVGEQRRVVAREVFPEERVAHVEAGAAPGGVAGTLEHDGRMGSEVARAASVVTTTAHAPSTSIVQSGTRNGSATYGAARCASTEWGARRYARSFCSAYARCATATAARSASVWPVSIRNRRAHNEM